MILKRAKIERFCNFAKEFIKNFMIYDFNIKIERENTNCVKYDLRNVVFGNPEVLPMWVADMDFETPDFAREAVMKRAMHGVVCGFNMAVLAFTQEGDEVIIQSPVYPPFHHAVSEHGRKLVYNSLKTGPEGYEMDFDLLERQAKSAKMLILCNPHNPVGRCWTREELQCLSEICLRNNVLVISDEIHCDLVLPGYKHTPYATLGKEAAEHCIVFHAASKTFNLAGLATSTAIVPNKELRDTYVKYVEAMEAHLGNIFGKVATQASMEQGDEWLGQLLDYVQGNIDYVSDYLSANLPKVRFFKPQATYMMWLDFNGYGLSEEELWRKMTQEAQLGFNRGSDFGQEGRGFFRINLACPRSTVEEAMRRLQIWQL